MHIDNTIVVSYLFLFSHSINIVSQPSSSIVQAASNPKDHITLNSMKWLDSPIKKFTQKLFTFGAKMGGRKESSLKALPYQFEPTDNNAKKLVSVSREPFSWLELNHLPLITAIVTKNHFFLELVFHALRQVSH